MRCTEIGILHQMTTWFAFIIYFIGDVAWKLTNISWNSCRFVVLDIEWRYYVIRCNFPAWFYLGGPDFSVVWNERGDC